MCNPRRVRVTATRNLTAAWREEIEQTASLTGTVTGEARITHAFGADLPAPVRAAFARMLDADPAWQWADGGYRLEVEGGVVTYFPDSAEVEIHAWATAEISAEASARREMSGTTEVTGEGEGEGEYYEDGFAGRTKGKATKAAREAAERAAEADARARLSEESAAESAEARRRLQAERGAVEEEARANAAEQLRETGEERRVTLEADARRRLEEIGERCMLPLRERLRDTYVEVLTAYARSQGAQNLVTRDEGGVATIEFEMRA